MHKQRMQNTGMHEKEMRKNGNTIMDPAQQILRMLQMNTTKPQRILRMTVFMVVLIAAALTSLCACGNERGDPYAGRTASDLSGYESMADYDGEVWLTDTTAAEAAKLMEKGKTFVLFAGYEECAYCNRLIPELNEAAAKAGRYVGYIDTRSNPEWMTNNDIDDFDKFLECFGDYLTLDENGEKHLYTPDVYFVKDGKVAARHDGLLEGVTDPEQPLTEEQTEELLKQLEEEFAALE